MFNKTRYWSRRNAGRRGQDDLPAPKLIEGSGKAPLVKVKGQEVHIPRKMRRRIMRKFLTDVRKGRIDLQKLNEERLRRNRDRAESR